jgi:hypothetical protein
MTEIYSLSRNGAHNLKRFLKRMIKMQFSLNAFDPTAKKSKFKITVIDGKSKNIFFQNAYSEEEIRSLFPDAIISCLK